VLVVLRWLRAPWYWLRNSVLVLFPGQVRSSRRVPLHGLSSGELSTQPWRVILRELLCGHVPAKQGPAFLRALSRRHVQHHLGVHQLVKLSLLRCGLLQRGRGVLVFKLRGGLL
jgi:hypothetical protein